MKNELLDLYERVLYLEEALRKKIRMDFCPKCKADTTFIRVRKETYDEGLPVNTVNKAWRCLWCLSLFAEEKKEI